MSVVVDADCRDHVRALPGGIVAMLLLALMLAATGCPSTPGTDGGGNEDGARSDDGGGELDGGDEPGENPDAIAAILERDLRSDDERVRRDAVARTSAANRAVQQALLSRLERSADDAIPATASETIASNAVRRQEPGLAARWYGVPSPSGTDAATRERRLVAATEQWIAAEEWQRAFQLCTLRPAGPYAARTEARLAELREQIPERREP